MASLKKELALHDPMDTSARKPTTCVSKYGYSVFQFILSSLALI